MKNIFLDLDGTLIDSSSRHVVLLEHLLNKFDIYYDQKTIDQYLFYKSSGNSTKSFLINLMGLDILLSDKISNRWAKEIESPLYIEMDTLYEDTIPFLTSQVLCSTIYFVSARQNAKLLYQELIKLNILEFATKVEVVNPKNALHEKFSFISSISKPGDICIGDTEIDYQAAKLSNIQNFILNRGFRNELFWNEKNVKSYPSLLEIEAMLDN